MRTRTSLGECGHAAVVFLLIISGAHAVVGQTQTWMEAATDPSFDISLAATQPVTQVTSPEAAQSSVEQGPTELSDSFKNFREWRLEERRKALEDTKFELNLRTYYLDRSDFSGAEKQAWAIGGWLGVKTGYFLDHVAFGATVFA